MAMMRWYSLLVEALEASPGFVAELSRQLEAQAKAMLGIALDDGYHAFMPPDEGFSVHYQVVRGVTIASVDGDLLGPRAEAFPTALAWRSRGGHDPRPTETPRDADLEFFWMELPSELGAAKELEAGALRDPGRFGFAIDWAVTSAPDVWLRFTARATFSAAHLASVSQALHDAQVRWNREDRGRIHYLGRPELSDDAAEISVHVDLGSAGLEALDSLLLAVSAGPAGDAIARCRIGRR